MTFANAFYIMLFMSAISALAWLLLLLVQSVGRVKFPHIFFVALMIFFIVPVTLGNVKWIDPDQSHMYIPQFLLLAKIWIAGTALLLLVMLVKTMLLWHTVRKCISCTETNILAILDVCAKQAGIRRTPAVFIGKLNEPACVVSCLTPAIVLSEAVISELNDEELYMVLLHECTHIRHLHLFQKRLFDILCRAHWMNPLAWVARREFFLSCEMDCDTHIVKNLSGGSEARYVHMLVRLMGLSVRKPKSSTDTVGILAFMEMKQRLGLLLRPVTKLHRTIAAMACLLILCGTIWGSISLSKAVFYPYPAYQNHVERSGNINGDY